MPPGPSRSPVPSTRHVFAPTRIQLRSRRALGPGSWDRDSDIHQTSDHPFTTRNCRHLRTVRLPYGWTLRESDAEEKGRRKEERTQKWKRGKGRRERFGESPTGASEDCRRLQIFGEGLAPLCTVDSS